MDQNHFRYQKAQEPDIVVKEAEKVPLGDQGVV